MGNTETWVVHTQNGQTRNVEVDPDEHFDGWNLFFETKTVGETNFLPAVFLYGRLIGREIKPGDLVTPAHKAIAENKNLALLVMGLYSLIEISGYQNLYNAYNAGKLPQDLERILNHQPAISNDVLTAILDRGGFDEIVLTAEKRGDISFNDFNDTDDPSPDWFLKYNMSFTPIPGYMGRLSDMGKFTLLATKTTVRKETVLEQHKKRVKQEIKETVLKALQDGTSPETIFLLADEIRDRYKELKDSGKTIQNSPTLLTYTTPRRAGFVIDVADKKVFDMRPYCDTMRELLEPDIEALKEFYYAVRRYVTGELKKSNPATERTPETLFENTPFLMMKNSRESNAIASVSGSMLQIAVQQELALQDEKGNTLYNYTATAPMKSGEVIISVKETPKGGVLRPSTEKLHILFDTLFTKSGYREFVFPIDAYMELCKRTPGETTPEQRRKFRQKLRQDLQRMKSAKFSANLPGCKPGEIGILNAWLPAPNNCMYIKLESLYCDSLNQRNAGKMQIPQTIFKTNEQNPHLIPIMRALCRNRTDYHNINMEYAKGGRRAHTISLKTLYEWDLALPRWAKIKEAKKDGTKWQFRRLIIEPLFNAIKELNDENYITSQYIDKDGTEHTPEEMKTAGIVDILDPEKWLLSYEVVGFKDDPEMIKEAIERERKRIESANEKPKKKKKKE